MREKKTVAEEPLNDTDAESLRITDTGTYLLVEFFGKFSAQSGKHCVDRMAQACVKLGRTKVLLDCRRIQGELPVFARFEVAEYGASKRQQLQQLALISRQDIALPDNFVENVAVNRGMNMKIFLDFDQAVLWLTKERTTN